MKVLITFLTFLSFFFSWIPFPLFSRGLSSEHSSYFWSYTKPFSDFSDPGDIKNYFTGVDCERISVVVKKNEALFTKVLSDNEEGVLFYLLDVPSLFLKEMPFQKLNPVLQGWLRSSPRLFAYWNIYVSGNSLNYLEENSSDSSVSLQEKRGWKAIETFFEQERTKGLIKKEGNRYLSTTDLVFSFPSKKISFNWKATEKQELQLRIYFTDKDPTYSGYEFPFITKLRFDIEKIRSEDFKISSAQADIETSYRNLWYVDYFSSANLERDGELNQDVILKEAVQREDKGKVYQQRTEKKLFTRESFSTFFSSAINYREMKQFLTSQGEEKFSVLFSENQIRHEWQVKVILKALDNHFDFKRLVLRRREGQQLSSETIIHQLIPVEGRG